MTPVDFLTIENDLVISGGKFRTGDATHQHIADLLVAYRGEYIQHPTIGVDIRGFILDERSGSELRSVIVRELEKDGIKKPYVKIEKDLQVLIAGNYG